ncbi:hypothetical protein lerEdw1_004463 [Lerista edwardsae]|nr:hypothetical protein lerEdw1_004463 [Lerista edwardsae]
MLRSQIVVFALMLGFLGNWFAFLGVSIQNAGAHSLQTQDLAGLQSQDGTMMLRLDCVRVSIMEAAVAMSALSLYVPPWRISSQLANHKSLDLVKSRLSIDDSAFSLQTPAESRTTFALLHQLLLKYLFILSNKLTCSSAFCEFWFFGFAL